MCVCVNHRELSWVKIYNVDDRYEANRIEGNADMIPWENQISPSIRGLNMFSTIIITTSQMYVRNANLYIPSVMRRFP